ncbi:DUF3000 family protein [Sanguibacter sp. A247]|uniref:DUF3000 family protein n=1 Tax=unclassified Sanguibacter TaxID=2645534 RepID=UPI003FD83826
MVATALAHVPAQFAQALVSLRSAAAGTGIALTEIPAPSRAAAYAVALSGSLVRPEAPDDEVADGTFVVLYDPPVTPVDDGAFRVIVLIRAALDEEMSGDPMLPEVAWDWMLEALEGCPVPGIEAGGSVTRTITTHHGAVAGRPEEVELELRASWSTKDPEVGAFLVSWARVMRQFAGVPPLGITALDDRR